jgi:hypothetical protein
MYDLTQQQELQYTRKKVFVGLGAVNQCYLQKYSTPTAGMKGYDTCGMRSAYTRMTRVQEYRKLKCPRGHDDLDAM